MTASPAQTTPAPLAAYDIAASLALAAGLVAYALIFYADHTSGDAGALYMAAWLAGNGQGEIVYREAQGAMRPEMSAAQQALGVPRSFPYYYPPLWAHVLAPLAVSVSYETFETVLQFAELHKDIIDQFGRFPHRNDLLGRENTPEENEYLSGNSPDFGQSGD